LADHARLAKGTAIFEGLQARPLPLPQGFDNFILF
jgi:hypothetical protein